MSGPYFRQGQTRFFLPKAKHKAAFAALKKRCDLQGDPKTLAEALDSVDITPHEDEEGNIDAIRLEIGCHSPFPILDALAPFVKAGSSLVLQDFTGDGMEIRMHSFDGSERAVRELDEDEDVEALTEEFSFAELEANKPAPSWKVARTKMSGAPRPYAIKNVYAVGEWVDHKTLGTGFVLALVEKTKVRIRFESGDRVLIHGA